MKKIDIVNLNLNNYGNFYTLKLNNKLLEIVTRYFLWKIYNTKKNRSLSYSAQRLYAYDLFNYFKILIKFSYDWKDVKSKEIRIIRDYLDQEKKLDRRTINRKTYIYVDFYQWCTNNKIKVNYKPKYKKVKQSNIDKDDYLLGYRKLNDYVLLNEFYLTPLRKSSSYKVLSESEFDDLIVQLRNFDIMYEAIAITMITTGLRIDEVLQLQNTSFLPSSLLESEESLEFFFIPKGEKSSGKKVFCLIPFETWNYLCNSIFKIRIDRLEKYKFKTNYLFIDKKAKEIKAYMVQEKFRKISEKENNRKIVPHMLRHTYATWLVMEWARNNKINTISESFYKDIHEILSNQLNHKNVSTTKMYCKAASQYKFLKVLPQVTKKVYSKKHIKENLDYLEKEGYN